jgi:NADH dehydrogenase
MFTTDKPTTVLIIGGGYAGAIAANRLRKRDDIDITVINPRPEFVERVRLHQFVAGTGTATADFDTLLGNGIRLVVDTATRIDADNRTVSLASGSALDYDYLIYAVGSTGAIPSAVHGAAEFAFSAAELESAQRLQARLDTLAVDAPITVVGAGLTGIETAAELAEQDRHVTLVCGGVLAPSLSGRVRRYIAKWLTEHNVTVLENEKVAEVRSETVVLTGGAVRPSAATIWAAGFGVPQLAANSGLSTDEVGRLLTDETLTSLDDDRIVATGDAAAPSGQPLRMSCQATGPLGAQAADTVLSRIAGAAPAAIDLALVGSCVSLGRHAAARQFAHKDDVAMDIYLRGGLGAAYKEFSSKLSMKKIRQEARKPGSIFWPKGGPRPQHTVTERSH